MQSVRPTVLEVEIARLFLEFVLDLPNTKFHEKANGRSDEKEKAEGNGNRNEGDFEKNEIPEAAF